MRRCEEFSTKDALWEVWLSLRWKEKAAVLGWAALVLFWLFGFIWSIYAVSN